MNGITWLLPLALLATYGFCAKDLAATDTCTDVPVIQAAWKQLPKERRFPCDAEHLVVIRNLALFLKDHPNIAADGYLRERAVHAFAFCLTPKWPIYINLDTHPVFENSFAQSPWIALVVAGVLVHESVHANGDARESSALLEEYRTAKAYQTQGRLPESFDVMGLEKQYREALAKETTVAAKQ